MSSAPNGDTFTLYLDSGAAGVEILNDANGDKTYSNFRVKLAVPIRLQDPMNWYCAISEAVYQTPIQTTDSVFVYIDCISSVIYNNVTVPLLTRIPAPAFPGTIDGSGNYPVAHYEAYSWPVAYTQTTTIIPWAQVISGSITEITAVFADDSGNPIISPYPGTPGRPTPFNLAITFKYFGSKSF